MSDPQRIAVVGCGYVGLTLAVHLASRGHNVVGIDNSASRVAELQAGRVPFFETGLQDALSAAALTFSTLPAAVRDADLVVLAVGTPSGPDGRADLSALHVAVDTLLPHLAPHAVLVTKSTVPPGTTRRLAERCGREAVHNPEFLRQGSALADLQHPARIVIGATSSAAADRVAALYDDLHAPILRTSPETAELAKYASNAMLATRLSFVNELSGISAAVGADIDAVTRVMGLDPRIGDTYLRASIGYGGSCLPKDVPALSAIGRAHGLPTPLADATHRVNRHQRQRLLDALGDVAGKRITVWGIAFKEGTDDARESPGLWVCEQLLERGATVTVVDPQASDRTPDGATVSDDTLSSLHTADALFIGTPWPTFREVTAPQLCAQPQLRLIVDGHNLFDPASFDGQSLRYVSVGRRPSGGRP